MGEASFLPVVVLSLWTPVGIWLAVVVMFGGNEALALRVQLDIDGGKRRKARTICLRVMGAGDLRAVRKANVSKKASLRRMSVSPSSSE